MLSSKKIITFYVFSLFLGVACVNSVRAHAQNTSQPAAKETQKQQPFATPAKTLPTALDRSSIQSQALLSAIDGILKRAAAEREAAKALPGRDKFFIPPLWTETREEREKSIRTLLDSALEIVTDAPVVKLQQQIRTHRETISTLRERIAELREKRLSAPESGFLPGVLTETQDSLDRSALRLEGDIRTHEVEIGRIKQEIGTALNAAGVSLNKDQLDLLLDSILGSDLLKLVTAFEVAKIADQRLGTLVKQSNEDLRAARRYFAMHAALFALLVHGQDSLLERIDTIYLPKLDTILKDIARARQKTKELIASQTRDDQRKTLDANLKSQDLSEKVATFYRDYLQNQRRILAETRTKTVFDLRIADNTYETVEASFQLRILMDEARTSFEALQKLEAPGFEQIFRNDNLRREFENLTQKLAPSS